jgi:hypothetical protein
MRFPILISPLWRAFLLPFGGTPGRSFAEVEDGQLHVRMGCLFNERFLLADVEAASPSHWPVWAGIGWRTSFRGTVGLIGTYVNIVEVRFKEPQRVRMVVPMTCRRLYLSLDEPRDFVAAVQAATAAERPPEPAAAGGRPRRRRKAG